MGKLEAKIIVGMTGSVAVTEALRLIRVLRKKYEICAVLSDAAKKLISKELVRWFAGEIVEISGYAEHIKVVEEAKLMIIAPATANTISKIAHGIADTPVTLVALSAYKKIPIIIAPAMHINMYTHPVIQENLKKLEKLGFIIARPRIENKKAKIASAEEIAEMVEKVLKSSKEN